MEKNFKTFFITLFQHFGGILLQLLHVVDDSISIQLKILFQFLFNL